MQQYRLIEALGRPFDTAVSAARMIYSGVFDRYPKLKVLFVHMGGALAPVICRLDWNWELNYKGIQNPPIQKVDKNLRKPSEYFKSNIYVDSMGPSAIGLKAMVEMCGVDRVLFGTDFGPVPMSPEAAHRSRRRTIPDAGDREKIFSTNTLALFHLAETAPRHTQSCLALTRQLLGIRWNDSPGPIAAQHHSQRNPFAVFPKDLTCSHP
jgi:predicted TIM-barrel fold metal-dependent hydrolase